MLRPIGDRVLLRPVPPAPAPDRVIATLEPEPTVQGDVLAVGAGRCAECRSPLAAALAPGMRVALRPTALYQEITVDGETLWMVPIEDVIGEVEAHEVTHA